MIRRLLLAPCSSSALAAPVSAQLFGGIVYDPTNYANAVLRYGQLQQQLAQLITTYQQIRTQYLLLAEASRSSCPSTCAARYRSLASPVAAVRRPRRAYGTTAAWIADRQHRPWRRGGLRARDAAAGRRTPAPSAGLSAEEAARVAARYDRSNSPTASVTHGLEALGRSASARRRPWRPPSAISKRTPTRRRRACNTQIAVLNKINATAVTVGAAGQGHELTCWSRSWSSNCSTRPNDARPRPKASTRTSPF